MGHWIRHTVWVICLGRVLVGCQRPASTQLLTSETFQKELDLVYSLYSHQEAVNADSVVKGIMRYSLSRDDSISLSRCYVSVLLALDSGKSALHHIDLGYPSDGADDYELMRRHSFRFQAFLALNACDSAWRELDRGFRLVERNDKLQLKQEDLELNKVVLAQRCPR